MPGSIPGMAFALPGLFGLDFHHKGEWTMGNKYGNERLAESMSEAVLDFVNHAIDHQIDNLDLSDKAQEAVDDAVQNIDFADQISDFDWSNVIDSDLILQNVDLDAVFSDWIERRFERHISSIIQDFETSLTELKAELAKLAQPKPSLWAKLSSWFQNVIKKSRVKS